LKTQIVRRGVVYSFFDLSDRRHLPVIYPWGKYSLYRKLGGLDGCRKCRPHQHWIPWASCCTDWAILGHENTWTAKEVKTKEKVHKQRNEEISVIRVIKW